MLFMPSIGYIIAVPLGLITMSVWWVRSEDASFQSPQRDRDFQMRTTRSSGPAASTVALAPADPVSDFDHQRYGTGGNGQPGGTNLGRDLGFRPLGERAEATPDWLEGKESRLPSRAGGKLAKIADYQESPPPADPLATDIPLDAGYNIVADEVTKIEMGKQRVVFSGNVRMQSSQFFLTSDQLVVFLEKDKTTMRNAEAIGDVNVRLTNVPPERACRTQSGRAVYDPKTDVLVLKEWPKIKSQSQEQISASADTVMTIITKTGKMDTQGKALTRITKSFVADHTGSAPPAGPTTISVPLTNSLPPPTSRAPTPPPLARAEISSEQFYFFHSRIQERPEALSAPVPLPTGSSCSSSASFSSAGGNAATRRFLHSHFQLGMIVRRGQANEFRRLRRTDRRFLFRRRRERKLTGEEDSPDPPGRRRR